MYQPQKAYFPPMYRHQDVFFLLTYQRQKLILHRCVGVVIYFTYGCIGINITFIASVSTTNVFSSSTYRRGVLFLCQYQIILFRQCIGEKSSFLANVSTTESHHLTNVSATESHLLIDASTIESHRSYKRELVKCISAHFLTDVSTIEPHISIDVSANESHLLDVSMTEFHFFTNVSKTKKKFSLKRFLPRWLRKIFSSQCIGKIFTFTINT
jgi:hypothetical protein